MHTLSEADVLTTLSFCYFNEHSSVLREMTTHTELRISRGYSLDLGNLQVFSERVTSLLNDILVASEYKLSSL